MIRSVRIHDFGGPEVLRIEEVEVEKPGEGEVRIRIRAIGINRAEITLRSGRSPAKPPLPTKIGFEAAGEIEAIGAEVKVFAIGDRVALVPAYAAQGESPKYICDQMGHSSVQVTFDIYGHLFPQAREEAAAKLQKAMFAGRRKPFGSSLVAKPANRGANKHPRNRPN